MITYSTDSIFKSSAQALVNPVNTVGVMGKGLAKLFKYRYPEMHKEYHRLCQSNELSIGDLHFYYFSDPMIINFPTKKHWANPAQIAYICLGLNRFAKVYPEHNISSVSFPQLGCGVGGLDWRQVKPIMEHYLANLPIHVWIHIYDIGG